MSSIPEGIKTPLGARRSQTPAVGTRTPSEPIFALLVFFRLRHGAQRRGMAVGAERLGEGGG